MNFWCWLGLHKRQHTGDKTYSGTATVCLRPRCTWFKESKDDRARRAQAKIKLLKSGEYRPEQGALSKVGEATRK